MGRSLGYLLLIAAPIASCAPHLNSPTVPPAAAPASDTVAPSAKAEVLNAMLRSWEQAGGSGSVAVMEGDRILFERGYGFADRAAGRLITPETVFDIGSLVKRFTAVAILQLEARGALSLSDTLPKYFDDVPADKRDITIRQVLVHEAGLIDLVNSDGSIPEFTPELDFVNVSREEVVRRTLSARLLAQPGTARHYSNWGYSLLGMIVEKASGQSYERYVQENIFAPAGMRDTGYLLPRRTRSEMAIAYRGGRPWGATTDFQTATGYPSWMIKASGGMLSKPRDILSFIRAMRDGRLLGPAAMARYDEFFLRPGRTTESSFGSNGIYYAGYVWRRSKDQIMVVFTNNSEHTAEQAIEAIAKEL
jgi:CubicO group peptidase (beta-lactamase class C family)